MANEFLNRKLTNIEKEEIKKQAKKIMDNFASKLSEIKETKKETISKKEFEREEKLNETNKIDKEIMFQNAPIKNKDFIIAEKKKW